MRIFEGMPVDTADGPAGEVAGLVIDPSDARVTHLEVRAPGQGGRLVPLEAMASCDGRVRLTWSAAQLARCVPAAEALSGPTRADRVPRGAAEIRRESEVLDSQGERVGHVDGLQLGTDHFVTHVLLGRGRLWGRREITIPVTAVDEVGTAVRLRVTREQVGHFRGARVHRAR